MIVAVPEILVAFVASLIIMAGIEPLHIGHKMRKPGIEFRDTDAVFFDDGFWGEGSLGDLYLGGFIEAIGVVDHVVDWAIRLVVIIDRQANVLDKQAVGDCTGHRGL